ncbi:MAG: Flp family type IVb pilin [Armatimonadota bacterium]
MGDTIVRWKNDLIELLRDESATTALEYMIVLALVAVVVILAYQRLGLSTTGLTHDSTQRMPRADGP